jgi:hypothetical protein
LIKRNIDPPYNKNHDNTDRYYQLTVWNTKLTSRLATTLFNHIIIMSIPHTMNNSNINVMLHSTYIFPHREYNHITAYTRTPQSNILRNPYYNTPRHTHIRVPTLRTRHQQHSDSNRTNHSPHLHRLSQSPITCIKPIHFSHKHLSMYSLKHDPHLFI